jgi:hypothetical protein
VHQPSLSREHAEHCFIKKSGWAPIRPSNNSASNNLVQEGKTLSSTGRRGAFWSFGSDSRRRKPQGLSNLKEMPFSLVRQSSRPENASATQTVKNSIVLQPTQQAKKRGLFEVDGFHPLEKAFPQICVVTNTSCDEVGLAAI